MLIGTFQGDRGRLLVHCSRVDGSLVVFATNATGRLTRAQLDIPTDRAADVVEWTDDTMKLLRSETSWLCVRGDTILLHVPGEQRPWQSRASSGTLAKLRRTLREWASAAAARGPLAGTGSTGAQVEGMMVRG